MADGHYMNPFWFVPTSGDPGVRCSVVGWGLAGEEGEGTASTGDQELLTGRITVRLKTLTALHVTGRVDARPGGQMTRRHFYRRRHPDGSVRPVVEGSSIRGMLRAYIEALTNGFASVYIESYEKVDGRRSKHGRHIGFWVGPPPDPSSEEKRYRLFSAVRDERNVHGDREGRHEVDDPAHIWPPTRVATAADVGFADDGDHAALDAASVLFGLTARGKSADASARQALAGRVRIDDAWFSTDDLTDAPRSLDLSSAATMGGAKPNKSSWWYFPPGQVRERIVNRGRHHVAEFVGADAYRGRKFYFHQDPKRCVQWYMDNRRLWRDVVQVPTECIGRDKSSESFVIHFDGLPRSLVRLLLVALCPSRGVRHKLGALRPFGFGSVEFVVESIELLRSGADGLDLAADGPWRKLVEAEQRELFHGFDDEQKRELALAHGERGWLVDNKAWSYLRLISTWPGAGPGAAAGHDPMLNQDWLFVYPPFKGPNGFAKPVSTRQLRSAGLDCLDPKPKGLGEVAGKLQHIRSTIDLDQYQRTAHNYQLVKTSSLG